MTGSASGRGGSTTRGQEPGPAAGATGGQDALRELALLHGVLPSWVDPGTGRENHASEEALLGVLAALGAPVAEGADANDALRAARLGRWERPTGPVSVSWAGASASVDLRLRGEEARADLDCRLVLEDGEVREWRSRALELADVRAHEREGRTWLRGRLALPGRLPAGYHELTVRCGAREGRTWVVRAPVTTWDPREGARADGDDEAERAPAPDAGDLGLFLPLYALRTARSWGTADLTDLGALLSWCGERGVGFVGTLPLMASFLDAGRRPFEPSPYAPASRLFWNELYLDVERAPGLDGCPEARELLASAALREEVRRLRDAPRARHAEAMAVKRRVLEALVRAAAPPDRPLGGPLADYAGGRPEAVVYARFRAVGERLGRPWPEWPPALRDGSLGEHPEDGPACRYHLFVQWAMEAQVEDLARARDRGGDATPCRLYLDLPLGSHSHGFDVWRHRDAFVPGLSGGAPPDAFFVGGQNWGFPPLHPERTREDAHGYTRRSLRHLMRVSEMVRLDHVMSLHRLYCIPHGTPAGEGAYVRYPAEELFAVLCIESRRARCEVVGEDLGTVPDEVREAMARHRVRRMYVLPFQLAPVAAGEPAPPGAAGARPPTSPTAPDPVRPRLAPPPALSVASLGTHDMPPFAAFWSGHDIERRLERGLATEEEAERERDERRRWRAALAAVLEAEGPDLDAAAARSGALRLLAASPARHVLLNAEDLWLEVEPQNVPGTRSGENWSRKALHPLEAWSGLPEVEETLLALLRARARTPGRRPGAGGHESPRTERKSWPT